MASKKEPTKGYQLEQFLEEIPDKYKCSYCQDVARDIHMLECCRKQVCLSCIEQYLNKQPCPQCQEKDFGIMPLKKDEEKISNLRVYCTEKRNGCDWTGQLKQLNDHLHKEEDGCQYSPRECPKCHELFNRCEMTNHLTDSCPKREYNCPHCGQQNTYEFVMQAHMPECSYCPLPCPNLECGVTCERNEMEHHIKEECEEQHIDCEYKYAGCDVKYRRKNKEKHMKFYQEQHREMYEIHTLKLTEKWQQLHDEMLQFKEEQKQRVLASEKEAQKLEKVVTKLEQKVTEITKENQQKAVEIDKLERKVDRLERQLQDQEQTFDHKIEQLKHHDQSAATYAAKPQQQQSKPSKVPIQQPDTTNAYQWEFTINNFAERRASKERWESSVMTTPNGYKLQLEVWPSGQKEGRESHVSVWLHYLREEGDERKWSARVTMTLELLKQDWVPGNNRNVIIMESFDIMCDKYTNKRRYNLIGTFSNTLIAHKTLDENQLFLKDNSLKMRITLLNEQPIDPNQSDNWK